MPRGSVPAEAPPGHLSVSVVAHHALWDSWVHERDILVPLGVVPAVEADEVAACLRYAAALAPAVALNGGAVAAGRLAITASDPDLDLLVEVGDAVARRPGPRWHRARSRRGRRRPGRVPEPAPTVRSADPGRVGAGLRRVGRGVRCRAELTATPVPRRCPGPGLTPDAAPSWHTEGLGRSASGRPVARTVFGPCDRGAGGPRTPMATAATSRSCTKRHHQPNDKDPLVAEALIIDACRTPRGIGKQGKGALAHLHPQHVAATVLEALVDAQRLRHR